MHAAVVVGAISRVKRSSTLVYDTLQPSVVSQDLIEPVPLCDAPETGTVLSYTVIFERKRDDTAIILAETANGERFLASSTDTATVQQVSALSPAGRAIEVEQIEGRNHFRFQD